MTLEEHDRACLLSEVWHTIQEKRYTLLGYSNGLGGLRTVGCWHSFGVPDVVVHALDIAEAKGLLHAYVAACRAGKRCVYGRTYYDDVLGRFLQFHPVAAAHQEWFHPWELFGVEVTPWAQLVWSDKAGRWPWSRYAADDCLLQESFTTHAPSWGQFRPASEPRRWDRHFATNADYVAHQKQIQAVLVRGGWRTPDQAARTLATIEERAVFCAAIKRQAAEG